MKNTSLFALILIPVLTFNSFSALAQEPEAATEKPKTEAEKKLQQNPTETKRRVNEGRAFGLAVENDSRKIGGPGSDQAYSNGIKVSYVYARDQVPRWAPGWLTESNYWKKELTRSKANFGVSLNHQIYTPNNTSFMTYTPNDRPYAAWLNVAFAVQYKNEVRSQNLELSVGMVGPAAIGEQVQNGFHRLIGVQTAAGWAHQLNNEPALQLSYQQRIRFIELRNKYGSYFDMIPMAGGGLGNVFIGAHAGVIARIGLNLPADFGPSRPSGGESDAFVSPSTPTDLKSSYYFFGGIRGNAIARNIFLDGNTFQPSHRVTKYPFHAETEVGVGIQVMPVSIVWRYVVRAPEFEENSGFNSFASVGLTYFTN